MSDRLWQAARSKAVYVRHRGGQRTIWLATAGKGGGGGVFFVFGICGRVDASKNISGIVWFEKDD